MSPRLLSPIERTCLRWVARGKTFEEIAALEGKSVPEIEGYLKHAVASLEPKSVAEALAMANLSN